MTAEDPLTAFSGWREPVNHYLIYAQRLGMALVFWPSGRCTVEEYAATAVISGRESRQAGDAVRAFRELELAVSAAEWRRRAHPPGLFVKTDRRGRRRGRLVRAVAWVHPHSLHVRLSGRGNVVREVAA